VLLCTLSHCISFVEWTWGSLGSFAKVSWYLALSYGFACYKDGDGLTLRYFGADVGILVGEGVCQQVGQQAEGKEVDEKLLYHKGHLFFYIILA